MGHCWSRFCSGPINEDFQDQCEATRGSIQFKDDWEISRESIEFVEMLDQGESGEVWKGLLDKTDIVAIKKQKKNKKQTY